MTQREELSDDQKKLNWLLGLEKEILADMVHQQSKIIEKLQKAAKAQAAPRWIPVSERLPDGEIGSQTEYLVYETLNNKVQHDYFMIPSDESSPFWNYYFDNVTHWMPLPAAPEQNK